MFLSFFFVILFLSFVFGVLIFIYAGEDKSLINPKQNKGHLCLQQHQLAETDKRLLYLLSTIWSENLDFHRWLFFLSLYIWYSLKLREFTHIDNLALQFLSVFVFFSILTTNTACSKIHSPQVSLVLDHGNSYIVPGIKVFVWLSANSKRLYSYCKLHWEKKSQFVRIE